MDFFKNLLLACLITLFMQGCKEGDLENQYNPEIGPKTHSYELNLGGVPLKVEVAVLAKEREKGLMFRKSLGLNEGMLFIFKNGTKQRFWMKNTRIPLDIGYFSSNGSLSEVHKAKPHDLSGVPSRSRDIKFVLELNAGSFKKLGIRLGERLEMNEIIKILRHRGLNPKDYNILE